jgi:4-hydroxymandelate oxidase
MTSDHTLNSLNEFRQAASAALPLEVFDFIDGGAGDEATVRWNEQDFERIGLIPRVLRDVEMVELATAVVGTELDMPVVISPSGSHQLAHPEGERATARAAGRAGICYCVSCASCFSMEEIAGAAPGPKWFQLYIQKDRGVTQELIERAVASGYQAICLTVDAPRMGRKDRDLRNRFRLPPEFRWGNFSDTVGARFDADVAQYIAEQWDASVTWTDLQWVVSLSGLPVLVKGIVSPADARMAIEHGAAAIGLSNHGGRQLDGVLSTIRLLPEIADAVAGEIDILLDGGVRRGSSIVKALRLGASAIMVGRPVLWGLAVSGQQGVETVLSILRDELHNAMTLLGVRSVDELGPDYARELRWRT